MDSANAVLASAVIGGILDSKVRAVSILVGFILYLTIFTFSNYLLKGKNVRT